MTKAQQWGYICVDCGRKHRSDEFPCRKCGSGSIEKICCNLCANAYDLDIEGTHITCRTPGFAHTKCKEIGDRCPSFELGDW